MTDTVEQAKAIAQFVTALELDTVEFKYIGQSFAVDIAKLDVEFWRAALVSGFTSKVKGAYKPGENTLDSQRLREFGAMIAKINADGWTFAEAYPTGAGSTVDPLKERTLKIARARMTALAKGKTGKAKWSDIFIAAPAFGKYFKTDDKGAPTTTWNDEQLLVWVAEVLEATTKAGTPLDIVAMARQELADECAMADALGDLL